MTINLVTSLHAVHNSTTASARPQVTIETDPPVCLTDWLSECLYYDI